MLKIFWKITTNTSNLLLKLSERFLLTWTTLDLLTLTVSRCKDFLLYPICFTKLRRFLVNLTVPVHFIMSHPLVNSSPKPRMKFLQNVNQKWYQIQCLNCESTYIGLTGQYLEERLRQHKYDLKNVLNPNKTALKTHVHSEEHNYQFI